MGEIAEMMLDGTLCAGCGSYLKGDSDGLPRYCHDCNGERGGSHLRTKAVSKVKCPTCGKLVKKIGLTDHQRDAHGAAGAKGVPSSNLKSKGIEMSDTCNWEYIENDGYWTGECGIAFCFQEATPVENDMNYCPKCGKKLVAFIKVSSLMEESK